MKLFGSRTSPFVRKVRVVAKEREVPHDFVEDSPWAPSGTLRQLTPIGKVPVLLTDDGMTLFESLAIIEYLDSLGDPAGRLLPAAGPERWAVMRWHALAQGVIDASVVMTLEGRRPEALQMADRVVGERQRIERILDHVETELPAAAAAPGPPGLHELMLTVALRYIDFRQPYDWRRGRPKLAALVDRVSRRPSFLETDPPG